jgi:hypothetical protein
MMRREIIWKSVYRVVEDTCKRSRSSFEVLEILRGKYPKWRNKMLHGIIFGSRFFFFYFVKGNGSACYLVDG